MKRTIATLATSALLGAGLVATTPGTASAVPDSARAYGLTTKGQLVTFNLNNPNRVNVVGNLRGLQGDTRVIGMDQRPANRALYAVGNQGGLYILSGQNAQARKVAQLSVPLEGTSFGVDVNPAADALRIVSNTGQNLRFSFAAGTTTADTPLNTPDASDPTTGITAAAYTNNDTSDATGTSLLDISSTDDQLVLQIPANAGTITPQGKAGLPVGGRVGFDIRSTIREGRTIGNDGFAVFASGKQVRLYRVDLTSGRMTNPQPIGKNRRIFDVAVIQPASGR